MDSVCEPRPCAAGVSVQVRLDHARTAGSSSLMAACLPCCLSASRVSVYCTPVVTCAPPAFSTTLTRDLAGCEASLVLVCPTCKLRRWLVKRAPARVLPWLAHDQRRKKSLRWAAPVEPRPRAAGMHANCACACGTQLPGCRRGGRGPRGLAAEAAQSRPARGGQHDARPVVYTCWGSLSMR